MSRIGKLPLKVPAGVEVKMEGQILKVKGPKGELAQDIDPLITVGIEDGTIVFSRGNNMNESRSKHGLYRALAANMVKGVSEGYKLQQELVGVGYRAQASGQNLELTLGYSHNIMFQIPKEVKVTTVTERGKNPQIILESHDKQLIGQVAAKIRSFRKPEPYKGKGIRFVGEQIRRKAGKSAAKK